MSSRIKQPKTVLQQTIIVLFNVTILVSSVNAQVTTFSTRKYPVEELQEDFNFMRNYVQHKGTVIYLYNTKEQTIVVYVKTNRG
jgi:hypothetical protein